MEKITSPHNPRIKQVTHLRDKKGRIQENRFVVDYERDLQRAVGCGCEIDYVLYCPSLGAGAFPPVDAPVFEITADLMAKISYRENPSSIVAVLKAPPPPLLTTLEETPPDLILGLVGLQKPGNIGALLRTADATGFTTILLIDIALDLYNPNIIRSSTGAVFLNNCISCTTGQALAFFQEYAVTIIAAAVDGEVALSDAPFVGRCATILGTEDTGLGEVWLQAANIRARIPMRGTLADSLNVSVSGAMFMYEAMRQHLSK